MQFKRVWADVTSHLLFEPLEFLEQLAALTPRPRINLILYYGMLAPHARFGTAAGGRSEVLLDRPNGAVAMRPLRGFEILVLTILVASAWGCGSTATKEGTGEYVDDSVITTKVKAAIFNDSTLKVNEINVETFKGVVQLSGFVRSQADIDKAVQVARGVAGVKSVKNDMRIK